MLRPLALKILIFSAVTTTSLLGLPSLYAEDAATTPAPSAEGQQTVVGEVVDPAAYIKDGTRGADATEKTYMAVDGGQTLAILENGTNNLYLLFAEQTGEDPNELAYDYVNQQVTAKGRVYEKGGVRGFVAVSVEPVATPAAAAETPAAPVAPATQN